MATKKITEVRTVNLKDFRGRISYLLAVELGGSHSPWIVQPEEIGLELDIENLTKAIKDRLELESIEATEVVMEVMDILNNSKIETRVGGAHNHLLIVEIKFPKPEPEKPVAPSSTEIPRESETSKPYSGYPCHIPDL